MWVCNSESWVPHYSLISTQQRFLINWKAEKGFGKRPSDVKYSTEVHQQMTF